jgi:hypothetical protein
MNGKQKNICEILPIDAGCIIAQIYCLTFFCTFLYLFISLSPLPQYLRLPPISISLPIAISLAVSIFLAIFISRHIAANENYSKKGKRSKQIAVFCLLIEKSPINFVLLGSNSNTLN